MTLGEFLGEWALAAVVGVAIFCAVKRAERQRREDERAHRQFKAELLRASVEGAGGRPPLRLVNGGRR